MITSTLFSFVYDDLKLRGYVQNVIGTLQLNSFDVDQSASRRYLQDARYLATFGFIVLVRRNINIGVGRFTLLSRVYSLVFSFYSESRAATNSVSSSL